MTQWVVTTISGYSIDFLVRTRIKCGTESINTGGDKELLGKGAITELYNHRGGFYSNLFLVPKMVVGNAQ